MGETYRILYVLSLTKTMLATFLYIKLFIKNQNFLKKVSLAAKPGLLFFIISCDTYPLYDLMKAFSVIS